QHHQLTNQRVDKAEQAAAHGLKHGAGHDAKARQHKMHGNDAQRAHAHARHLLRSIEKAHQHVGHQLKNQRAHEHDAGGRQHAEANGMGYAVLVVRAVVVGDDGHHAVVKAEHRHKDEAL